MKPDLKQGLQIRTLALYNVRMMRHLLWIICVCIGLGELSG